MRFTSPWRSRALWILLAVPAPAVGQSGEELYTDYFGCWNCHGRRGEGGEGRPLRDTDLPLGFFLKELRLPTTTMPPFSPLLATDGELALVYEWLGGADRLRTPLPMTLELEAPAAPRAGEPSEIAVVEALPSEAAAAALAQARYRYRLTLFRQDGSLVADQPLRWQTAESPDVPLSTDAYGEAWLGPEEGFGVREMGNAGRRARLAVTLAGGDYVLVLEAVGTGPAESPSVLGVGTVVLEVE